MNRFALVLAHSPFVRTGVLAALCALAAGATPARAALNITVADVGAILNQSVSLGADDTPGLGGAFDEFFEFTLPVRETVTLSMTDSANGPLERIAGGVISLNAWTSTAATPPFQPLGALIESSAITNFAGGQGATVSPDALSPGAYFAEISGVSGLSPLHIAVDSTATGTAVPEPSTWALLALGLGVLSIVAGFRRPEPRTPCVSSPRSS